MKTIKLLSAGISFTIIPLFIGSYFALDLPFETLIDTLKGNLIFAILGGALATFLLEWSLKKGNIKPEGI